MEKHIVMRPVEEKDFPEIESIIRKIWNIGVDYLREERYGLIGGKNWDDWKVERSLADHRRDRGCVYVTELNGKVVGFFSYEIDETAKIGTVGENGVHPDYRGKGIGGMQIEKVLQILKAHGMKYAEVVTGLNEKHFPARKMYEKAGFKPLYKSVLYTMELI